MPMPKAASKRGKSKAQREVVIPDKLYFRIGDVAKLCGVETYVLRFWETEFPQMRPNKSGTGQRLYRKKDVELALKVRRLLHDEGYTIAGARQVLASLGADGMLLAAEEGNWFGTASVDVVRSDVGAGDASLAGFLGAGGAGPEALASALAHGAAAVQLPGSVMPSPSDLRPRAVQVTADIPLERPLRR